MRYFSYFKMIVFLPLKTGSHEYSLVIDQKFFLGHTEIVLTCNDLKNVDVD